MLGFASLVGLLEPPVLLPSGFATDTVTAFLAAAEAVAMLSEGQTWNYTTRPMLLQAVERSLCSLRLENDSEMALAVTYVRPICSLWKISKFASAHQNTSSFEASMFQEIVAEELAKLGREMSFARAPTCWNPAARRCPHKSRSPIAAHKVLQRRCGPPARPGASISSC